MTSAVVTHTPGACSMKLPEPQHDQHHLHPASVLGALGRRWGRTAQHSSMPWASDPAGMVGVSSCPCLGLLAWAAPLGWHPGLWTVCICATVAPDHPVCSQFPPSSKNFQEAQGHLNQAAAGLNQSANELVQASRGTPQDLARASGKFGQDFNEFLQAGVEMASQSPVSTMQAAPCWACSRAWA